VISSVVSRTITLMGLRAAALAAFGIGISFRFEEMADIFPGCQAARRRVSKWIVWLADSTSGLKTGTAESPVAALTLRSRQLGCL
jgi:hypothetical protein